MNILFLRAGFFMENLIWSIEGLKQFGVFGALLQPDIEISMIATSDIGQYAAERLLKCDFTGHETRELLGQRDVTMLDVTKAVGDALNQPFLPYSPVSEDMVLPAVRGMGASDSFIEEYFELSRAMNIGLIKSTESRSAENTTDTSIEEYARVLAELYHAG
jgi:uncharacterized protein YbjT (DUF2867 family)